ncbi:MULTISPECIES: pilus assembly protein TadG-related protein [Streptomyces]|uniref:pilus assembly protein TadG-related protein n=1 Tax=Streptomyces TaxID=1883 RepID=UPI001F5EE0EC|nr:MULTISPECIES: pilus assembly protein TadG-related protein [Streptomyces]
MSRDAGQAFPLYITAVAALLFLALAFFVVGRAGAAKNATQTAADAAALAAAQDFRDQLRTGFLAATSGPGGDWAGWLAGRGADRDRACRAAAAYAEANGAQPAITCEEGDAPGSFHVSVTSARTVGASVVPGTEDRHATATAEAVVAPRCVPRAADGRTLSCDEQTVVVDPRRPEAVVTAADLFTVRLTE